ncbi:hypothetical protein NXS08_04470 [Gleimia sp. 6138-11-ORH1]|uniref:hypothetical protein n=1 Tax=Gleimia sp. 6138-11-ORH1 TaxID=2973937 RepID=UPI002168FA5F|nr:hypothetical protein [Gleimia sp. 6138-11-ORH1]MCS4484733.1 hypothetical protein [Gleimia sp. 6138-11-ORH1]
MQPEEEVEQANLQAAGMVTAETALTIPAVVAIAVFLIAVISIVGLRANTCVVAGQVGRAIAVEEAYPFTNDYTLNSEFLTGGYVQVTATLQHRFSNWMPVSCKVVTRLERK